MVACDGCGKVREIRQIVNVYDAYEYYCGGCSENGTEADGDANE